jgi:hypothetical protein
MMVILIVDDDAACKATSAASITDCLTTGHTGGSIVSKTLNATNYGTLERKYRPLTNARLDDVHV